MRHYGGVEDSILHPLIVQVQALPPDQWVNRGDPESYTTKAIRKDLPPSTTSVLDWIERHLLVPGFFNRVVFSLVPSGEPIKPHTDNFGEEVRRASIHLHLPLITHPSVVLGFTGIGEYHFKVGHLYSMDESYEHYVRNPSDVDRVHLLMAFWPHDKNIEQVKVKGTVSCPINIGQT